MLSLLVAMWPININYHAFIFYSSFMVALLLWALLSQQGWNRDYWSGWQLFVHFTVSIIKSERPVRTSPNSNHPFNKQQPDRDEFIFVHCLCCIVMAKVIKIFYVLEIIVNYYNPKPHPFDNQSMRTILKRVHSAKVVSAGRVCFTLSRLPRRDAPDRSENTSWSHSWRKDKKAKLDEVRSL